MAFTKKNLEKKLFSYLEDLIIFLLLQKNELKKYGEVLKNLTDRAQIQI